MALLLLSGGNFRSIQFWETDWCSYHSSGVSLWCSRYKAMRLLTGTPRELDSGNSVTSTKRCQVYFLGSWQSLKSSRFDDGKLFSFPHCLVATHFRADTFYSEHKIPRIIKPGNSSRWPNLKSFSGDGNRGSGVARNPGSASSCSPVRRT